MRTREQGFTLLEVLVAAAVLLTGVVALCQLVVISTQNTRRAHAITIATSLAQEKLAQLSALTWTFDAAGLPVSDTSTDTTTVPESPAGGTGLRTGGNLHEDVAGYHDMAATFVRRWSIEPVPADAAGTVVIQVIVADHEPGGTELARAVGVRSRRLR